VRLLVIAAAMVVIVVVVILPYTISSEELEGVSVSY
jgi:hypothetical protein